MERSGLEGLAAKGQLQGAGRAAPGLAAGIAKGAYGLAKGMVYDPIAAVGDMLKWQEITSPDGQVFYMDPEGREYSEAEYNKELYRRTLGMTLSATGLMSAPGVAPQAGPGVVAGANRLGVPKPTVLPPNKTPYANWQEFTAALRNGDPAAINFSFSGRIGEIPGAPPLPSTGSFPAMPATGSRPAVTSVTGSQPAMTGVTGSQPAMTGVTGSRSAMPAPPPGPPPVGRAPLPSTTPPSRASLPPRMPPPPPAGAPKAAVKSWFGRLPLKDKVLLTGIGALGATGFGLMGDRLIEVAANKARRLQAQPGADQAQAPMSTDEQPAQTQQSGPSSFDEMLDPITGRPITSFKTPAPAEAPSKAKYVSRAGSVIRTAAGKGASAATPAAAATATAPTAAGTTDKVPVTTSGRPDYNYYAEIMNAADRNDAYARDLINLKEQARMAAIDAGARGEKFRFVPVKDYMNNRIIFVNAGGNDVVLDMNDPRQGVEYQKLIEKSGIDASAMTDWIHRSSKPMLRYMQPMGGNRDIAPDFGFMRRSVEMGESKPAMQAPTQAAAPTPTAAKPVMEEPKPTATPPVRPEPQPTSVAAVDEMRPAETMQREPRRQVVEYKPALSVAQSLNQGTPSVVEEAKRLGWDYETNEPRAPLRTAEEEEGIRRAEEYFEQNQNFKPGFTMVKTKVTTRRR